MTPSTDVLVTAICRAWADALEVPSVAPDTDVFTLGAHSLLILIVAKRVHDATGVKIPIRSFLETPTPLELAARVAEHAETRGA